MDDFVGFGSNRPEERRDNSCCYKITAVIALVFLALCGVGIYAFQYTNRNNCDQTKEALQLKHAEESNMLLQLQNCQDEIHRHQEIQKGITEKLHKEVINANGTKEKLKIDIELIKKELDNKIRHNHLLSMKIVQLHHEHIKEINGILNDLQSTQSDFKQLEEFFTKNKNKIMDRQNVLNNLKNQINQTLKSYNSTIGKIDSLANNT